MNNHSDIRPAVAGDIPALKRIIEATEMFPPNMLEPMMAGFLQGTADREYWKVHGLSRPDAVAFYRPEEMTDGTWNLLLLAVDPASHGQGIGVEMLEHVEQHLTGLGQRLLLIETSGTADFAATRQFYRKCGHEEEARIRDYYEEGDDKIVFRKRLDN
ncbi:MAG: GNAT family N-acetyltransferase [Pseudomonadota bacterium]